MDSLERIIWARSSALPGAEILRVANCSNHAWTLYHERYAICVPTRGGVAGWRYRGKSLFFYEQGLGLFEPGETHTTTSMKGSGDFDVLFVSPEVFLQAAEERGILGQAHFRLAQFEDRRLSFAIQGLVRSIQMEESCLEQQSWLALCLHGMHRYTEQRPMSGPGRSFEVAINLARNYLRDHYRLPIGLDELAALTGLNRFSVVHYFSSKLGMPPHAYQIHIQVERARALLESGVPPAAVAAEVGFSDQSHLNRHFKKIMQVTPGQYQRYTCRSAIHFSPAMEGLSTLVKPEASLVLARYPDVAD